MLTFLETHVSQHGVKDEDGKVDMEPNKYNTNTQQCNCQDKKGETDNHSKQQQQKKMSQNYLYYIKMI